MTSENDSGGKSPNEVSGLEQLRELSRTRRSEDALADMLKPATRPKIPLEGVEPTTIEFKRSEVEDDAATTKMEREDTENKDSEPPRVRLGFRPKPSDDDGQEEDEAATIARVHLSEVIDDAPTLKNQPDAEARLERLAGLLEASKKSD